MKDYERSQALQLIDWWMIWLAKKISQSYHFDEKTNESQTTFFLQWSTIDRVCSSSFTILHIFYNTFSLLHLTLCSLIIMNSQQNSFQRKKIIALLLMQEVFIEFSMQLHIF